MKKVIISAVHKNEEIPEGTGCMPVLAGAALFEGSIADHLIRDDSGDNISCKNREYCELTALYWAWKNLDADILGLCHYRRFFSSPGRRSRFLQPDEAVYLLDIFDVLLPAERDYIIETNLMQYAHSHHIEDLDLTKEIIEEMHPEYIEAFDRRMSMTRGHRFNMFVMKKNLADGYCSWLFDILSELEKRLDITGYAGKDRRVFGFVAERLLDVWIDHNQLRTTDLDYIFIGGEHLLLKGAAMIRRKIKARS